MGCYYALNSNIMLNLLPSSTLTNIQRHFCQLTHVDSDGKAKMVDVSDKPDTNRGATAKAIVEVGPKIADLIQANNMSKGDVLSIAQLAGIIGAKKTSELIPLCHNIFLSSVKVNAVLNKKENAVEITATVCCTGKTGVEMEALTAVSIAALTVYDMCKAVSHDIVIKNVRLFEKFGGKKYFKRD